MATVHSEQVDFMVVDDDPRMCRMLTSYFEAHGHSARSLEDGTKLLPWLALNSCSAVVLDLDMPAIDGLTVLTSIRDAHPTLPVVIFTGAGYNEDKLQRALSAGANGYVSKGLKVGEIYAAVLRAIGWRQEA